MHLPDPPAFHAIFTSERPVRRIRRSACRKRRTRQGVARLRREGEHLTVSRRRSERRAFRTFSSSWPCIPTFWSEVPAGLLPSSTNEDGRQRSAPEVVPRLHMCAAGPDGPRRPDMSKSRKLAAVRWSPILFAVLLCASAAHAAETIKVGILHSLSGTM